VTVDIGKTTIERALSELVKERYIEESDAGRIEGFEWVRIQFSRNPIPFSDN
jgi:hypothetical protein